MVSLPASHESALQDGVVQIISLLLPVYFAIGIGFGLRRVLAADDAWVLVLNRYGMYVGFPVLVFANLIAVDKAALAAQLPVYALNAGIVVGVFALGLLVTRWLRLERRWANTLVIGTFFGNVAYLGYPMVSAIAPNREPELAVLIAIYVVTLFTAGIVMLELSKPTRPAPMALAGRILRNPFIVAILAAIGVLLVGVELPRPIVNAINMIKASASPVVLVALGVFLGAKHDWPKVARKTALLLGLKMIAFPAIFVAIGLRCFSRDVFLPSVLEAGMPMGVTVFALSSMYDMERDTIAAVVVTGTLLAAVSIPALAWWWLPA